MVNKEFIINAVSTFLEAMCPGRFISIEVNHCVNQESIEIDGSIKKIAHRYKIRFEDTECVYEAFTTDGVAIMGANLDDPSVSDIFNWLGYFAGLVSCRTQEEYDLWQK